MPAAGILLTICVVLLFAATFHLLSFPIWWDEGWNLLVAQSLATRGIYGEVMQGREVPVGVAGSATVILPIALSYKLLGIGLLQSRLPALLWFSIALGSGWLLCRQLFSRKAAAAFMLLVLTLYGHGQIYAASMGTQAVGEMPMLACVLLGYVCFLKGALQLSLLANSAPKPARRAAWLWIACAALCFGLSLATKLQIRPFLFCALAAPLIAAAIARQWRLVKLWSAVAAGSCAAWSLAAVVEKLLLPNGSDPIDAALQYSLTALVTDGGIRSASIALIWRYAGAAVLAVLISTGLFIAGPAWRKLPETLFVESALRLSLTVLCGSWFVWFAALSAGWPRYLFPPAFLSLLLLAAVLSILSADFSIAETKHRISAALRKEELRSGESRAAVTCGVACLAALVFEIAAAIPATTAFWYRSVPLQSYAWLTETAGWLNTNVPPRQVVETYESQLLFLLDAEYHHPPAQLHLEMMYRRFFDPAHALPYDPMRVNPDFLVVGSGARTSGLYRRETKSGDFALVRQFGPYAIFRRVRVRNTDAALRGSTP